MTDPLTGIKIPKTMRGTWRGGRSCLPRPRNPQRGGHGSRRRPGKSPIFWLNAFGWTFLQKKVDQTGGKSRSSRARSTAGKASAARPVHHLGGPGRRHPQADGRHRERARRPDFQGPRHGGVVAVPRGVPVVWQFRPQTTFLELSRKEFWWTGRATWTACSRSTATCYGGSRMAGAASGSRTTGCTLENTDTGSCSSGSQPTKTPGRPAVRPRSCWTNSPA
jgi:hypothetical protein